MAGAAQAFKTFALIAQGKVERLSRFLLLIQFEMAGAKSELDTDPRLKTEPRVTPQAVISES